jgi:aryl-alcohol dehydrogenase-like predicted oxidoreductase
MERIKQLCRRYGWPEPVALQQQHSYLRARPGAASVSITGVEQLDWLRANDDVTLVAYSPILKGVYDDAAKQRDLWMMADYAGPDAQARFAAVAAVAAEVGATPNQVVLAWLMQQTGPRVVPLIGPRTPEHLEDLLPALDVRLPGELLERLDGAGG